MVSTVQNDFDWDVFESFDESLSRIRNAMRRCLHFNVCADIDISILSLIVCADIDISYL